MNKDIRWIQRFENYKKAFQQLENGVNYAKKKTLSDLEKEGLIQRFEYTQELAWQTIKNFYEYIGETDIQGSRDAFRIAFNRGLISDGKIFMQTIKSRNKTVHTYNEETVNEIFHEIINNYYDAFLELKKTMENERIKRKL